jgi:hypothetical protein
MSTDTRAALEAAVAAHVADECDGAMLTGWALIASNATEADFDNNQTGYMIAAQDRQPMHSTLGLIHHHLNILEDNTWTYVEEDDDE